MSIKSGKHFLNDFLWMYIPVKFGVAVIAFSIGDKLKFLASR